MINAQHLFSDQNPTDETHASILFIPVIYRRHLSSTRWNNAMQSVITHGQNLITQSGHYHHPNSQTGSSMTNMVKSNQALDQ